MADFKKVLGGAGAGFLVGGPLGGLVGAALGAMLGGDDAGAGGMPPTTPVATPDAPKADDVSIVVDHMHPPTSDSGPGPWASPPFVGPSPSIDTGWTSQPDTSPAPPPSADTGAPSSVDVTPASLPEITRFVDRPNPAWKNY